MSRLTQMLAAGAGALLIGALGLGLLGARPSDTEPLEAEAAALRRQVASLRETNGQLAEENSRVREQAAALDEALSKALREWTSLDQTHKALENEARSRADALADALDQLEDAQAELTRLRREMFQQKTAATRAPVAATAPAATPLPSRAAAVAPALKPEVVTQAPLSASAPWSTAPSMPTTGEQAVSVLRVADDGQLVALDYGRSHGATEGMQLELGRSGGRSTTVVLTAVRQDFSVGLVLPDQWAADLRQGDKLLLISQKK